MVIMSVGSFYILFSKLFEQNKVMGQYKKGRSTPTIRVSSPASTTTPAAPARSSSPSDGLATASSDYDNRL